MTTSMNSENCPLLKKFQETLVSELLNTTKRKKIYEVLQDQTVGDVLALLAEKRILSVPVCEERGSADYVGMIDVLDIIFFILYTITDEPKELEEVQWSSWSREIDTLEIKGKKLGETPISSLFSKKIIKRELKWTPISEMGTVSQLLELFASGLHRSPVVEKDGYVHNIVSQSDIITFIANNITDLGDWAFKSLIDLGLVDMSAAKDGSIICMSESAEVIQAFFLMYYNNVNAVAIVDSKGSLTANLSASDVRGIKNLSSLLLPVNEFLKKYSTKKSIITSTPEASLETVIFKLAWFRVHRVWVIDPSSKEPIGIVSIQDILKLFDIDETS